MKFSELQKKVSELIANDEAGIARYLSLHKLFSGFSSSQPPEYCRRLKVAFLSNFTIQGLPEVLKVRGVFHNLFIETYLAPYNQYAQEILNSASLLHQFSPDIVYLLIDRKTIPDLHSVVEIVDQFLLSSKAKLVLFEKELADQYAENRQILFFDFDKWLKNTGHQADWYTKYKELGDLRLAPDAFPDLSESLLGYCVAVSGATKKCVVVDLDNTLWEGILGEDGFEKIAPDQKLQKFLLGLFNRGIILAINSRNNEDEALEAIEKHPQMILKKKHFAAWQINWGDKISNMFALAEELNLGIDSFVFLDDDAFQQNLLREAVPSVAVIPVSENKKLLRFLENYTGFSVLEITEEDARRGHMYAEERDRKEFQKSKTLEEFLKELNLKLEIKPVNEETLPRASQLTQKTNQFNLTTRRYSDQAMNEFLKEGGKVWTIKAKDRFGDYGIIGLTMVKPVGTEWRVENLLLSCRILERGVEKRAVDDLIEKAKEAGCKIISSEYRPTAKNSQVEKFWDGFGFNIVEKGENHKLYHYEIR